MTLANLSLEAHCADAGKLLAGWVTVHWHHSAALQELKLFKLLIAGSTWGQPMNSHWMF